MAETIIDIQNVTKYYEPGIPVLQNVSLQIVKGAFVTIIGPSGCGKTTLIRLINGMTDFDSGKILVMNKDIESAVETYNFAHPNATQESILSYLKNQGFSDKQIQDYFDLQSIIVIGIYWNPDFYSSL